MINITFVKNIFHIRKIVLMVRFVLNINVNVTRLYFYLISHKIFG